METLKTPVVKDTVAPQIGERYYMRDGLLSGTIIPNDCPMGSYPFKDSATGVTYTSRGTRYRVGEAPDDLMELCPMGGTLPDADTVTVSGADYREMQETIEMQSALIKKLKAAIDRKNKIFTELFEAAKAELS